MILKLKQPKIWGDWGGFTPYILRLFVGKPCNHVWNLFGIHLKDFGVVINTKISCADLKTRYGTSVGFVFQNKDAVFFQNFYPSNHFLAPLIHRKLGKFKAWFLSLGWNFQVHIFAMKPVKNIIFFSSLDFTEKKQLFRRSSRKVLKRIQTAKTKVKKFS